MNELENVASGLFNNSIVFNSLAVIVCLTLFVVLRGYRLFGMTVIPDDRVGRITKKFALKHLANGRIVATNGEAGYQAETLSPGIHFGLWPWQYSVAATPW